MLHTGNRISFVDTVHCKIDEGISHRPSAPPPVTSTAPAPAALVAGKDPLLEDFSSDEVEEGSLMFLHVYMCLWALNTFRLVAETGTMAW